MPMTIIAQLAIINSQQAKRNLQKATRNSHDTTHVPSSGFQRPCLTVHSCKFVNYLTVTVLCLAYYMHDMRIHTI